ncbi:MAG: hypothetical protein EBS69_10100 [Verrucomicrobia bacterium]|nr:hypothetical protein [Verrucomicrobiota bacterium]NBS79973.1 hypothetical protein [bacterium]
MVAEAVGQVLILVQDWLVVLAVVQHTTPQGVLRRGEQVTHLVRPLVKGIPAVTQLIIPE